MLRVEPPPSIVGYYGGQYGNSHSYGNNILIVGADSKSPDSRHYILVVFNTLVRLKQRKM